MSIRCVAIGGGAGGVDSCVVVVVVVSSYCRRRCSFFLLFISFRRLEGNEEIITTKRQIRSWGEFLRIRQDGTER